MLGVKEKGLGVGLLEMVGRGWVGGQLLDGDIRPMWFSKEGNLPDKADVEWTMFVFLLQVMSTPIIHADYIVPVHPYGFTHRR